MAKVSNLKLQSLGSGLTKLKSLSSFEVYEKVGKSEMKADRLKSKSQRSWTILKCRKKKHLCTSIRDSNGLAIGMVKWSADARIRPEIAKKEQEIMKAVDEFFKFSVKMLRENSWT